MIVLVVGNSIFDTINEGMRKTFVENYSGDFFVHQENQAPVSLFGAFTGGGANQSMPELEGHDELKAFLKKHEDVEKVSSQAIGYSLINYKDKAMSFTMLWGVDPEEYKSMFPQNMEILQGSYFEGDNPQLLLSSNAVERLEEDMDIEVEAGKDIKLTGFNNVSGMKIRQLPVKGVFEFKQDDLTLDMVSLIDIDTLRVLNGMTLYDAETILTEEEKNDLAEFSEESLFADSGIIEESEESETSIDYNTILGETSAGQQSIEINSSAWHFILVKLKDPGAMGAVRNDTAAFAKEKGYDIQFADWQQGAGTSALFALAIQSTFTLVVIIVAIVAIIIMMNTLVISITERTGEIGTIRAIGGEKGFVFKMVLLETLSISVLFGLIGTLIGSAIIAGLHAAGIETDIGYIQALFGGEVFRPQLSLDAVIMSFVIIMVVGLLSCLYPVWVALKVQPVSAMRE